MMETVRIGVFETNSSATHSIVCVRDEATREFYRQKYGDDKVSQYDEMFPKNSDVYTDEEVIESLKAIGAKYENGVLDLTGIPEEEYDFGYVDERILVPPAYRFLLVIAMRDDLSAYGLGSGCSYGSGDDYAKMVCSCFGIDDIIIPEELYGVNHQCRDELYYDISYRGAETVIRRKNLVLSLSHD